MHIIYVPLYISVFLTNFMKGECLLFVFFTYVFLLSGWFNIKMKFLSPGTWNQSIRCKACSSRYFIL